MDPESGLLLVSLWYCPRPTAFEDSAVTVGAVHRRPFKVHATRNLFFCRAIDLVVMGCTARLWDWVPQLIN